VLSAHGAIAARNAEVEELFGEFRVLQAQEEHRRGECRRGLKSRARRRNQTKVEAFESDLVNPPKAGKIPKVAIDITAQDEDWEFSRNNLSCQIERPSVFRRPRF
jgi:hypothetical protein